MDITIDTTHPLNDTDRAVLRALLAGTTTTPQPAHGTPGTPRRAADLGAVIAAGQSPATAAQLAAARGPVASQPGVTFTESTSEDTDPAA